jgi:hypothetical protein
MESLIQIDAKNNGIKQIPNVIKDQTKKYKEKPTTI